jgi:hypothetical protein
VELRHVRANFCGIYVTGDEDLKKARQASEKAWRRALEKVPNQLPCYATAKGGDGREWLGQSRQFEVELTDGSRAGQ